MSFDSVAETYERDITRAIGVLPVKHGRYLEAKVEILYEALPELHSNASQLLCLEFGCGTGLLFEYLSTAFPRLFGLEPSLACLEKMPLHLRKRVAQFDGCHIPICDQTADLVIVCCVLHHIPPTQRPEILAEIYRILKPGGTLAVIEHNTFHPLTRLVVSRCVFDKKASLLSASLCRRMLERQNFAHPRIHFFLFHPFKLSKVARRWQHTLFNRLPLGTQYLCLAKRP